MPVAIRKRSWEEHVTHPSGLQYSYDDLDLVCCHGVDSEGPWTGSGASKQGRRTRCSSMPEGCHQLPTDDLAKRRDETTSVVQDDVQSGHLMLMERHEKVTQDLQEEIVHGFHELADVDIPQRRSESEHHQTTNSGNSEGFQCNSNIGMSSKNIFCDSSSHSEKTINDEGEVGTESSQSHDICDDDVFKNPHISRKEQQCISISSNNGSPLSESAAEQPGKFPDCQETKESHTEGYSRPPEISETARKRSSAAELEPQTDFTDVKENKISTSGHAGASITLPVGMLHSSVNMTEGVDVMSQTNKTVEPVVTLVVDGECDSGIAKSWSSDSADKTDGLDDLETLNENTGLKHPSRDIQEGEQDHHNCAGVLDRAHGCEISYQTLLKQHDVEMTAMSGPQGEESTQAESSQKPAKVRYGPIISSDICVKGQCCSKEFEQLDVKGDPTQTNTNLETTTVSPPTENTDATSVSWEPEDQTVSHQLENSCSKLDIILEVSHVEARDTPVLALQTNIASAVTHNPDVHSYMDDKHAATEQHAENLLPCSAEVNDKLLLEGLHGNQASGGYFSESPASEVADGQSEHNRPEGTVSRMDETDESVQRVIASPALDGKSEPGDQKEDNVVKVRMRK
ncbi:hypothetical protein PAMP_021085 [Pampus punctatissimus]